MASKSVQVNWASIEAEEVQEIKPVKRRHCLVRCWTNWVEDGWLLECLSLTMGCVLLVALCLVLNAFDQHTVPDLGTSLGSIITVNTIVAIIGTAIQACLLYPVAECLGQLKWQWLRRDRKLEDLSTFDKASRGPTGALIMLISIKWAHLATLGALLIVSAVTISPFFQQLISVAPQSVISSGIADVANTTVLQQWDEGEDQISSTGESQVMNSLSIGMSGAIQNGLFLQQALPNLAPSCSSGNCTFPTYRSLGVCSSLANLTDLLQYREIPNGPKESPYIKSQYSLDDIYYLTSGMRFDGSAESKQGGRINMTSTHSAGSYAFPRIDFAIADVIIMIGVDYNIAYAFEARLDWCILEYATTVVNGEARTTVLSTDRTRSALYDDELWLIGSQQDAKVDRYQVSMSATTSLIAYLRDMFKGSAWYNKQSRTTIASSPSVRAVYQQWQQANASGIQTMMDNLATSMTNYIRQPKASKVQNQDHIHITGTVWKDVTIIVIRWQWITGPAVFAVMAIAFVLLTIYSTTNRSRQPSWKSSSVSLLHALAPDLQQDLGGLARPSEMRKGDEKMLVRLSQDRSGESWRVIGVS